LKALLGSISLLESRHLDETEPTRLLGVGVKHNLALLDFSVFGKETHNVVLGKTWVDTSHKEVGTGVSSSIRGATIAAAVAATVRRVGHVIASRTTIITLSTGTITHSAYRRGAAVAVPPGRRLAPTGRHGAVIPSILVARLTVVVTAPLVFVIHHNDRCDVLKVQCIQLSKTGSLS